MDICNIWEHKLGSWWKGGWIGRLDYTEEGQIFQTRGGWVSEFHIVKPEVLKKINDREKKKQTPSPKKKSVKK